MTALLLCACTSVRTPPVPSYALEWPSVVQTANAAADSGNYASAEKVLTAFAARFPLTREAHETAFWQALYKLDPANRSSGSVTDGLALLDRYIGDSTTIVYRAEAFVLKRMAINTQMLQVRLVALPGRDTAQAKNGAEAEITRLKEQLARTTAELDRIKKRLADPNK